MVVPVVHCLVLAGATHVDSHGMARPGGVHGSDADHEVCKAGTCLILLAQNGDMPCSVSRDK